MPKPWLFENKKKTIKRAGFFPENFRACLRGIFWGYRKPATPQIHAIAPGKPKEEEKRGERKNPRKKKSGLRRWWLRSLTLANRLHEQLIGCLHALLVCPQPFRISVLWGPYSCACRCWQSGFEKEQPHSWHRSLGQVVHRPSRYSANSVFGQVIIRPT